MIEIHEPEHYFRLQKKLPHIPFTQSEAWYKYLKTYNTTFAFFVDDEKDTKIATWGRIQKIPIIGGCILRLDGESYQPEVNEKIIKSFYSELSRLNYRAIEVNSNNNYVIDFEIGIRRAGFVRPYSLVACPLSIEIDLQSDFNFDNNWKRNVKKALSHNLVFEELTNITDNVLSDIILMFQEMADLKQLTYSLEHDSLKNLLTSKGIRTFWVTDKNSKPIAARIIHEHNNYLTDVFAANSIAARDCGATYYMMDSLLKLFKEEGKVYFDFGRIPPSNHATDSVYIFKNASRGRKIQYNGEWVFYKNKWVEYLMFVYKQFIVKKQRY